MSVKLSNDEKLNLISNLHTLLNAGIPVLEAVENLLSESKDNPKKVLELLKKDLNEGQTIASSFAKYNHVFDPVTVNLIKAAEESGTLDTTLKDLTVSIKKDIEFTGQIRAAMIYPLFVMIVFFGVVIMVLTIVIPRIALVFTRLRVNLPLPTKILIAMSDFFMHQFIWFALITVLLVIAVIYIYKTKRKFLLGNLSKLPLFSTLARDIDLTRFSRSMSLLLTSGIPITEALELSENMLTKKNIIQVIHNAKLQVSAGKELSSSFHNAKGIIPPMMTRIVQAGEKSGTLENALQDLAEYFDNQVSKRLRLLTTLLEPVLLVVIGILVGGVMLVIIAPIYGLIGQLQQH